MDQRAGLAPARRVRLVHNQVLRPLAGAASTNFRHLLEVPVSPGFTR